MPQVHLKRNFKTFSTIQKWKKNFDKMTFLVACPHVSTVEIDQAVHL
jgi:hypothetical protein